MKTKNTVQTFSLPGKLFWILAMVIILFIDYEFLLPIFGMVLKYFIAMLFAVCGPIIATFFLIRSFFVNKEPKEKEIL